ncbi:MAG TPA: BrnT family toxin [Candidatus Dormibacteraeota bacterium]|nr:BrnT family toxin [Candidatus Dormibacteraeota bacterium]
MTFEWNERKSRVNLAKHGVDFHTASLAFADPFALTMPDELHGDDESRFIMLAAIDTGTILFVVFTVRAQDTIRLISARAATQRERAIYEEAD